MSKRLKRRRLFYDIETSPNIGYFWRPGYNLNIGPDNIIQERAVICIAWKWEGEKAAVRTWVDGDDEALLKYFMPLLRSADEPVAHHGNRFDEPWLRGRCLLHGIACPPKLYATDTCALAKSHFNLNSNKLDYIARYLGIGSKLETSFNLWKQVVDGDKKALARMARYCKHDVVLLEMVHSRMLPYIPANRHYGVLDNGKASCPEGCGTDIRLRCTRTTQMGTVRRGMTCNQCGKCFTISNKVYEDWIDRES